MSGVRRNVSFAGCSVSIACEDAESARIADWLFAHLDADPVLAPRAQFRLRRDATTGEFSVFRDATLEYLGLSRGFAAAMLLDRVVHQLAEGGQGGLLLHAGCVARSGRAILIPGASGAGKTTLTAWLARRGFEYLTDELIFLAGGATRVEALRRPLNLKRPLPATLEPLAAASDGECIATPDGLLASPGIFSGASNRAEIQAIVFPSYRRGGALEMTPISPARTAMLLLGSFVNAGRLAEDGLEEASRLARAVPSCALTWGDIDEIGDCIDGWWQGEAVASNSGLAPR